MLFVLSTIESYNYYIPPTKTPPPARGCMDISYIPSMNAFFTFGGCSEKKYYDDTWGYYLNENTWKEILLSTDSHPSARIHYGGFTSTLNEKFYIFGGNSYTGLKNDFWEFDPKYLKWTNIETKNPPSVRYSFSFTSFVINGHEIFAIFGGQSLDGVKNDFYLLDMTNLEWHEMINNENCI
ncbi:hypothetical protein SteCoe_31990 [Stentor coeruleus]|uniref:Uncharacterized protein n=1 Tax=Stentor coeruleus TaxID=5963 RepID=A0A1R2B056_9CILI|nr:hypothetical protein SteCoe_31990 [Stentor coeruleus]